MALIATVTLAAAVLFQSPSGYRVGVCIIVSVAATTIAVRGLFSGKLAWALLFLGVVGIFTPFQLSQFPHVLIAILDMATLALFAASPMILESFIRPVVVNVPHGKL
jgi:hypothetical protein